MRMLYSRKLFIKLNQLKLYYRTNSVILNVFVLCVAIAGFFITNSILGGLWCFYDFQGFSLLGGHLNVPSWAIGGEAIVVNDKYYGYFGIVPSIIRIPLNFIFPQYVCRWGKLMNFVGYILTLVISFKFYKKFSDNSNVNNITSSMFLVMFGLGTSLLFLTSRSYVYHEAIMLGVAFGLISYYFLYNFLEIKSLRNLLFSLLFALLSAHSRLTVSVGNLVALSLVSLFMFLSIFWGNKIQLLNFINNKKKLLSYTLISILGILIISSSILLVNYMKFGNMFSFLPFDKHIAYTQNKIRLVRYLKYGYAANIYNIKHNFLYYFGPEYFKLKKGLLIISFDTKRSIIKRLPSIDGIEWTVSLLYSNPLLFLLILAGFFVYIRKLDFKKFVLISGSIITFYITLTTGGISERYFHDFYPFFLFFGIAGFNFLLGKLNSNKIVLYLFMAMIFYSACINFTITLISLMWLNPPGIY